MSPALACRYSVGDTQLAGVKKKFAELRRRRGVHSLIDAVKSLDLSFTVTVNGRHAKPIRPPRAPGVRMRNKNPQRRVAAPTPGRFGGKAKGRSDPTLRMFPNSLVRASKHAAR